MIFGDQLLITGGTFTSVHSNEVPIPKGLLLLLDNVAPKALYNSGQASDSTTCHPATRRGVLDQLQRWASSATHGHPITWLHGPAGVGKTTLMRTFAEILEAGEQLLADFFFGRAADRCDTSQFFASTLAYRMCITLPAARASIVMAIERNPLIFSQKLDVQLNKLVIAPILAALESGSVPGYRRFVLLIDGLDECQGSEQQIEVLRVLLQVTTRLPSSFKILIASRPDHHIQSRLQMWLQGSTQLLALNDAQLVPQEIGSYFLSKFQELKQLHPLRSHIPPDWPSHADICELIQRASGQFIYASTVVRFVSASRKHPARQLEIIRGLTDSGTENPFRPLDLLYSTIFSKLDKDDIAATLHVLGSILICRPPIPLPIVWDRFLGFSAGEVDRLLIGLESLLTSRGSHIEVYHASLKDFLFNSARSGPFFIDNGLLTEYLARKCVHFLFCPDMNIKGYIFSNIVDIFSKATATPKLREMITLEGSFEGDAILLDEIHTKFLDAIENSRFTDKEDLACLKWSQYDGYLCRRLSPYLESECSIFLLVAFCLSNFTSESLVEMFQKPLALFDSKDWQIDFVSTTGLQHEVPGGKVNTESLHAYRLQTPMDSDSVSTFKLHLWKSMLHLKGCDLYQTTALFLIKCMCMSTEYYIESNSTWNVPGFIAVLLPTVLGRMHQRQSLIMFIRDNPISGYYLWSQPEIFRALRIFITSGTIEIEDSGMNDPELTMEY